MKKKALKLFALLTACMMAMVISAAAYADGIEAENKVDELVEIDDDWGYVTPEVIEQHTPEMTQEFIHADDLEWEAEEAAEPAEVEAESEPEVVPEPEAVPETEAEYEEEAEPVVETVAETEPEVEAETAAEESREPISAEEEYTAPAEEPAESEAAVPEEKSVTAEENSESVSVETVEETEKNETAEESDEAAVVSVGGEVSDEPVEVPADETAGEPEIETPVEVNTKTEDVTSDETEEAAAGNGEEAAEEEVSDVTVKVRASMRSENLMHLKALVDDPKGNEYDYQWQVSVDGGKTFEDMEDMTEDFLDIELDEENISNMWRVRITAI